MQSTTLIEWRFIPPDFFGRDMDCSTNTYQMHIGRGTASVQLDTLVYEADPDFRRKLHDRLEQYFIARLIEGYCNYDISPIGVTKTYPDGHRDISLELESAMVSVTDRLDIKIIDQDGVVISDTAFTRIDSSRALSERLSKHNADPILKKLIKSFAAAVQNRESELFHLYGIRDAVAQHFGNQQTAVKALNITASKWGSFGQICNNGQVYQSRHSGQAQQGARDVTPQELEEVRDFARLMITGYLNHLDALP